MRTRVLQEYMRTRVLQEYMRTRVVATPSFASQTEYMRTRVVATPSSASQTVPLDTHGCRLLLLPDVMAHVVMRAVAASPTHFVHSLTRRASQTCGKRGFRLLLLLDVMARHHASRSCFTDAFCPLSGEACFEPLVLLHCESCGEMYISPARRGG